MKKTLCGEWKFKKQGDAEWKKARVPGCNYLDLMNNGDIPDPFVGLNEHSVQWVARENWEYEKAFTVSESEIDSDDILLDCEMLDTVCEVQINGNVAFKADNCFISYSESVKNFLQVGENRVKIIFYSPVRYVEEKYKACPTPINSNGQNGIVYIRKPQCHFGWDWGPVLPCSGIAGNIELEFVKKARIEYLSVTQSLSGTSATVKAHADIKSYGEYRCEITLIHPNGYSETKEGSDAEFNVESPELWWTHDMSNESEQPLYTVEARMFSDEEMLDCKVKKIGIRKLELNREKDEYGKNFQFVLNGVPLFIKGANYIPPDSFITRATPDVLEKLIDAAVFSNMNMLRIWGGGFYGSDEFYDLCDKKGILVWQDFQFACQAYPFFEDSFLESVKREVEYNVKRLSHRPSLALWNGNNEIEQMHTSWLHMKKYIDWTEKFFYHILENEIRKYDSVTPYSPGSPVGISHNKGVDSDNVGDTHLWAVWHGLKPMSFYRRRMTRFCSEFGFESLPDIKAVEKFADRSDYSLSSEVFSSHQKCVGGNDKMIYYIATRFDLPKKFEDYIYLSQVTQCECISDATEHWRRNKGRCNGAMYWQFNDCWGVCSWSSIDYYGNYKALQYGARHFNAPLSVSIEDSEKQVDLYILNDLNEQQKVTVECEFFDFLSGTREVNEKTVTVGKAENKLVFSLDMSDVKKKYDLKKTGLAVRLIKDGEVIQQKTLLFDKEKNLKIPKANLNVETVQDGDLLYIKVKTDKFARLVKLESSISSEHFSDNYFDILPSGEKTVTLKCSDEKIANSIKVTSLGDVELDRSKLKVALKKIKVFTSPMNIGNMIFHGKIAKDVEVD